MRQSDTTAMLTAVEYCIDHVANAHHRQVAPDGCRLNAHRHVAARIKYAEGQLVALSRVRRSLHQRHRGQTMDLEALLRSELRKWADLLAGYRRFDLDSPEWADYAQGGLDAITLLLSAAAELHTA